jgi:hypothetical protein
MFMKRLQRFTALFALAAFVGLSAVESFHSHKANQTEANCAVCQIAHRSPTIITAASTPGPHWISTPARAAVFVQTYLQFVLVSHGLSPPVL